MTEPLESPQAPAPATETLDNSTAAVSPALPLSQEKQNESDPSGNDAGKSGLSERLFAAASGVAQKFGKVIKPGRGRPKKDGSPKISDVVAGGPAAPVVLPAPSQAGPAVVPAPVPDSAAGSLFRRVCVTSVKSILDICEKVTRILAEGAGIEAGIVDRILQRSRPKETEIEEFTESLDLVLKKHNIQPKHAEEWALAISGVRLVAGYPLMWAEFRAEMTRNRQRAELKKAA